MSPRRILRLARSFRRDPARFILVWVSRIYNAIFIGKPRDDRPASALEELNEVRRFAARRRNDIGDHLPTIFFEAYRLRPRLVVELGVRGGKSSYALQKAADLAGGRLVSVDTADCAGANPQPGWIFVQEDDVEFAGRFAAWCGERGIEPCVDVLFIDTSHLYDHTLREIAAWFPLTGPRATVMFHDTHLRRIYFRRDGSMGIAWNNDRGVIRALETHFRRRFDERGDFVDFADGWSIRHYANSNGLTILTRI